MEFTVEFYVSETELRRTDPDDFASVVAGLAKLKNRQYHREPLSKALGAGLYEMRHVGKLNTRVFWFFMAGRRIVAAHAVRNKGRSIPQHELATARSRMAEWLERNH